MRDLRLAYHCGMNLPPLLVETAPDTAMSIPHLTWGPTWRPLIERFCAEAAADRVGHVREIHYRKDGLIDWHPETDRGTEQTFYLAPDGVADAGLRQEMFALAEAFYEVELPEGDGAILTGMLAGHYRDELLPLFAFVRTALVELSGQRMAAHFCSTAQSGTVNEEPDKFPPHSDMWHTELLFNVFNRTREPGEGDALLIAMDDVWDVLRGAGVPDEIADKMRADLASAGTCGDFQRFNTWMYEPEHPWFDNVVAALMAAATQLPLGPGQGYFVNDRRWMHGRNMMTWPATLSRADRHHRLYRLGYNNRRLMAQAAAEGIDWSAIGPSSAGCLARH